jgi:hypothetical protein
MQRQVNANTDVAVTYIGEKAIKREQSYGTRLVFKPGQTHHVISNIAHQMLKHTDVYAGKNSPELDAFIAANPLIAAEQGLVELSEDELKALLEKSNATLAAIAAAKADEADEDSDIVIDVNGGDEALESTQIEEVKGMLQACVNVNELKEWAEGHQLTVTWTGTRDEKEARLIEAYKAKYLVK